MAVVTTVAAGSVVFGGDRPFALMAGLCVIESEAHTLRLAERLVEIASRAGVPLVFKASYDKANRTSLRSYRGPGLREGLRILQLVKERHGLPLVTDIHEPTQAEPVAAVVDILQIPAFLSRQTDLLVAAAQTGRAVNIKKGQFLAPDDLRHVIAKVTASGNQRVLLTERGTSFGYHDLVVDMRALPMLRELGYPVIFDVTHSLQLPGAGDGVTAGLAQYIEPLASAGVGAGVDGLFLEVHDDPQNAKSDGGNALRLDLLPRLLDRLTAIDTVVKAAARRPDAAGASTQEPATRG